MSANGWIDKNSDVYQQLCSWILSQFGHTAEKIGISSAKNLKYTAAGCMYAVPHKKVPSHLFHDANLQKQAAISPKKQRVMAEHDAAAFVQSPEHAEELDQFWNDLCFRAQIDGVPRRKDMLLHSFANDLFHVQFDTVKINVNEWREDGDYTAFWHRVYQKDTACICSAWNAQRSMAVLDEFYQDTAREVMPLISEKLAAAFGEGSAVGTYTFVKKDKLEYGKFDLLQGIACNPYETGFVKISISTEKYASLLIDGNPAGEQALVAASMDKTRCHICSFERIPDGKVQISIPKILKKVTLNKPYMDKLMTAIRINTKFLPKNPPSPYLYTAPPELTDPCRLQKTMTTTYDPSEDKLTISCLLGTLQFDPVTQYFQFIDITPLLTAGRDPQLFTNRYEICGKIALEYREKKPYWTYPMRVCGSTGYGILIDSCNVIFQCQAERVSVPFAIPQTADLNDYENAVQSLFESAFSLLRTAFLKKAEARVKGRQGQYRKILSDPLDMAILHYVRKNETYVTANAIQQALRGLTVQLGAPLRETEDCGRFKFIPADVVSQEIESLCRKDLLCLHGIRGTYGKFYTVKLTENSIDLFMMEQSESATAGSSEEWWSSPETFRNYLLGIQEQIKNHEDARKEQLELMHHLENSHMTAYFHDDIVRSFPKEDKDLLKVVKMYRSMQENGSLVWKMLGHIIRGTFLA